MRLSVLTMVAVVAAVGMTVTTAAAASSQTISFAPVGPQTVGTEFPVSATSDIVGQVSIHGSISGQHSCTSVLRPAIPLFEDGSSIVKVDLSGDASPQPHLGEPIALTNAEVTVTTPADLLLQSYDFAILTNGETIPVAIDLALAGSHTVEGVHTYATIHSNVTLTIHDPDGVPGTGDESADPIAITASLPDTVWHPVDASQPVLFTEHSAVIAATIPIGDAQYVWSQTCAAAPSQVLLEVAGSPPAPTGLTVSFSSDTPTVCTVSGTTVTPVATGQCTIRASQPGDASFSAAPDVTQSFQINRGSQLWFGIAAVNPARYGSPPVDVEAIASLPVSFTSISPSVCSVSGTTTTEIVTTSMVTLLAGGLCTIEATQGGDSNWKPVTPAFRSFVVSYGVANLSPPSHTKFTRGSTIPVRFRLTDAHGHAIPDALAAGLGCSATVTFNGGTSACAVYEPALKLFVANIKTSPTLATGKSYPIAVRTVVGSTTVAFAALSVVADAGVSVNNTTRSGYWMLGAGGTVYAFGDAPKLGSASGPAVAISARTNGTGYWTVDAAGDVSHFGTATGHGGHPSLRAGESVSTISGTPSGNGYWLFTNRGRAFPFGDARFFGDMSAAALNGPIVASVATPTGRGYFMVGSDGGVFNFGDARFHGSTGNLHLNRPIVGISPTPDNRGYWLVASDGGVFAFDAPFRGSMGGTHLNQPINGLVAYGNGYLMVASDGGIFDFSDRRFAGSLAGNPPGAPIIGIAAFSV
jgi:hypothetical protein